MNVLPEPVSGGTGIHDPAGRMICRGPRNPVAVDDNFRRTTGHLNSVYCGRLYPEGRQNGQSGRRIGVILIADLGLFRAGRDLNYGSVLRYVCGAGRGFEIRKDHNLERVGASHPDDVLGFLEGSSVGCLELVPFIVVRPVVAPVSNHTLLG